MSVKVAVFWEDNHPLVTYLHSDAKELVLRQYAVHKYIVSKGNGCTLWTLIKHVKEVHIPRIYFDSEMQLYVFSSVTVITCRYMAFILFLMKPAEFYLKFKKCKWIINLYWSVQPYAGMLCNNIFKNLLYSQEQNFIYLCFVPKIFSVLLTLFRIYSQSSRQF
jgi:hypothetical protein